MKKYVKDFFLRGMMFGGFGPIIAGIIYAVLQSTVEGFVLTGYQVCLGIISTYLLAFIHAGVSVFNQIEHWSLMKSLFCHLGSLYIVYVTCYLINSWILFDAKVLLIFTSVFVAGYLLVWFTVFLITKSYANKMNSKL